MKVGDYYRTKYGINKLTEGKCVLDNIIKSSPNIIDLIEVGDYVNGHRIEEISINKYDVKVLYYEIPSDYGYKEMLAKQIKSIVTKEQFENMEYKVGD